MKIIEPIHTSLFTRIQSPLQRHRRASILKSLVYSANFSGAFVLDINGAYI
jgi:hypothetical protein